MGNLAVGGREWSIRPRPPVNIFGIRCPPNTPLPAMNIRLLAVPILLLAASPASAADPPKPADRPLPPKDAAKAMTLPPGCQATLFAGEPDVVQPIAFTFDDRG